MEKMTIKELFAILDSESATMAEKRAAQDELESRADEGLFFGDDYSPSSPDCINECLSRKERH